MVLRSVGRGKYIVQSHSGRRLSHAISHAAALHRLRQVDYFKNHSEAVASRRRTHKK